MSNFAVATGLEVMYSVDVNPREPEVYERFVAGSRRWLDEREIVLGEGVIDFRKNSDGSHAYELRAPQIAGPSSIFDVINIDGSYIAQS